MRYEILENDTVVNTIIADQTFVEENYPRAWRLVDVEMPQDSPSSDPRLWWIDVGPFKDRFDSYGYAGLKLTILSMCRTNDICYGVFADLNGRLYIDLKGRREELLTALGLIANELALAGKPEFTLAMQVAILDTPTTDSERYIKGL